jgi:chemotaxis signal transduction protein
MDLETPQPLLFKHMENVSEFKDQLGDISKTWDQLILLSQLGSTGIDMHGTKVNFNALTTELIANLANETLTKVVNEMRSKAQVAVDIVIRNLFERTADIGFLATDDDIRDFLLASSHADIDATRLHHIVDRFEEYVAKYSVYYDIVLFDTEGYILAKLDEENDTLKTKDEILDLAQFSSDDYIETYRYHDFLPHRDRSLVYTYKVTKTNESNEIIGYLSLCFKFEDEMEGIFANLAARENKEAIVLLNDTSEVIASSDKYHIPVGAKLEIELERPFKITQFAGRDYLIKTCKTNGYEGFFGLGWLGHIMIPIDSAFNVQSHTVAIDEKLLSAIMQNDRLFKKELSDIPTKAQQIQNELDLSVWNGNVLQMASKASNADFARSILREVKHTGEKTKESFKTSIEKLNQTIITSLLDDTLFLASLSIDIMDRNLYERANDCRWWALTTTFREILSKPTILEEQDTVTLSNILRYINDLYTVYTNLFIYDTNGIIIAVSNGEDQRVVGSKLSTEWVKQTLALHDSSKYSVSSFEKTPLYENNPTYIYGAAITSTNGADTVGGIGIVFDSTDQFKDMLCDALPKIDGKVQEGVFSLFVEKESKKIISCSNETHEVGNTLEIESEFFALDNGQSLSKILSYRDKYYIVGAKCSKGYREYKGSRDDYINDILAFVFIEAGTINDRVERRKAFQENHYDFHIDARDEVEEIATFYISSKWLGIKTSEIIEAIKMDNLDVPISTKPQEHFKGTIPYKDNILSILDISPFINNKRESKKNNIVIVNYETSSAKHKIGIVVDKLGEIMKIPKRSIKPFEAHLVGGGLLGDGIVQPPKGADFESLLTILDLSKLEPLVKQ